MIDGIEITVMDNGNLLVSADENARGEIREGLYNCGYWELLSDITEHYSTNGQYFPIDPSAANPFVGLTEAPCIAEYIDVNDSGDCEVVGNLWFFANHIVDCPIQTLADSGQVIFKLVEEH